MTRSLQHHTQEMSPSTKLSIVIFDFKLKLSMKLTGKIHGLLINQPGYFSHFAFVQWYSNTSSVLKHVAMNCRVNYRVKSALVWRNAVTRVKEEISVNIDGIDPWNLKFLSEPTETCGGMEAVHYSCDISLLSQMVPSRLTICFVLILTLKNEPCTIVKVKYWLSL